VQQVVIWPDPALLKKQQHVIRPFFCLSARKAIQSHFFPSLTFALARDYAFTTSENHWKISTLFKRRHVFDVWDRFMDALLTRATAIKKQ
jgi:hypothetical protein